MYLVQSSIARTVTSYGILKSRRIENVIKNHLTVEIWVQKNDALNRLLSTPRRPHVAANPQRRFDYNATRHKAQNLKIQNIILKRPLPPGRDVFRDNPRLSVLPEDDPLHYNWPEDHKSLTSIDPAVKYTWEDELFKLARQGSVHLAQPQGGDWGNNRLPSGIAPRVKVYYVNILSNMKHGRLHSAITVFEDLTKDCLVELYQIPYGVYHHMMHIFKTRQLFDRATDMFREILDYHSPSLKDYCIGMECCIKLKQPEEALYLWDSLSFQRLQPSTECWAMLMRAHAAMQNLDKAQRVFDVARQLSESISKTPAEERVQPLDMNILLCTLLDIYSSHGCSDEARDIVNRFTYTLSDDSTKQAILEALNKLGEYGECERLYQLWNPSDMLPKSIKMIDAYVHSQVELVRTEKITQIIQQLRYHNMLEHSVSVAFHVIRSQKKLIEHANKECASLITQFVNESIAFVRVKPSVRNYRIIALAQMENEKNDPRQVRSLFDTLVKKKIKVTSEMLDLLCTSYILSGDLMTALEVFKEHTTQGIVPNRIVFVQLFDLLAKLQPDRPNIAYKLYKISQSLKVVLNRSMAASIVRAIQSQGDVFGRLQTREEWTKWTSHLDSRTLSDHETASFDRFIETILETIHPEKLQDTDHILADWEKCLDAETD